MQQLNEFIKPPIGIILAGGKSSRMGLDKAQVSFNGRTFLSIATNALNEANCENVLLSGTSRAEFQGISFPDLVENAGPVSGIVSSILYISRHFPSNTGCLFLPIDMPQITSRPLTRLLREHAGAEVCYFEKYPLPFYLRISNTSLELAQDGQKALSTGQSLSIRSFLAQLSSHVLLPNTNDVLELENVNTPESLMRLKLSR